MDTEETLLEGIANELRDINASINVDEKPSGKPSEKPSEKPKENGSMEAGVNGNPEEQPEKPKEKEAEAGKEAMGNGDVEKMPSGITEKSEINGDANQEVGFKEVPLEEKIVDEDKEGRERAEEEVEKQNDEDFKDYDDMYDKKIGQFGIAQALIIFCICIPSAIPGPLAFFSQVFIAASPDHWCFTPELAHSNLTLDEIKILTIPLKDSKDPDVFSQCKMYDVDFAQYLNETDGMLTPNTSWSTRSCKDGWTYDLSVYESTIVTDWDLVCDKDILPVVANGVSNLGMVIGGIFVAYLSDKYGRKKGLLFAAGVLVVSGICASFAPEIFSWMFMRMFFVTSMSIFFTVYVYGLEFVGTKYRATSSLFLNTSYSIGLVLLSLLAYYIRDWHTLSLVISVPNILLFIAFWFLPESPRWLHCEGRMDELNEVLTKLARLNRKPVFDYDVTKLRLPQADQESAEASVDSDATFFTLFKTPNLRKRTLFLGYMYFVSAMTYFGLSLYAPSLGSNPFISLLLSGVAEIPGYVIGFFLMDHWGRRWTVASTFVGAGIFLFVSLELHAVNKTVTLVIFLISKMFITANFMPMVPFTSELLPTQVRNVGLSVLANLGIAGTAILPFVLYIGKQYLKVPMEVIGGMTLAAGFVTLLLPETLNYPLPETVVDAEKFGSKMKREDYIRCIPLKRKSSETNSIEIH